MSSELTHFAVYVDDIERAKKFYDEVFSWGFNSYGQSDFFQIKSDKSENSKLIGALQSRTFSPITETILGYECTIGVENIESTMDKVRQNGGQIIIPKTAIPYVGWIAKFLDTEGNVFCAMQYDSNTR